MTARLEVGGQPRMMKKGAKGIRGAKGMPDIPLPSLKCGKLAMIPPMSGKEGAGRTEAAM